jgi:hypothetical protein
LRSLEWMPSQPTTMSARAGGSGASADVERELRVLVAREPAGRLQVDELAEAVEEGRLAGRDAGGGQLGFEAQPGEDPRRVRQDVDADADGRQPRRSLVDFAVDAGVVQLKSERQPADARPDDREPHPLAAPLSLVSVLVS